MRRILMASVAIMTGIGFLLSCNMDSNTTTVGAEISKDSLVKRGEYLVTTMGCHDCHTPMKMTAQGPQRDMENMLSGHPAQLPIGKIDTTIMKSWLLFGHSTTSMAGPWGVSFSANITSDETGIGNWTEEQFKKAIVEGKYKGLDGSRPLLPPMPWENFKHVRDEDVKAIFTFLKSTKPVKNIVPAAIPPTELGKYL